MSGNTSATGGYLRPTSPLPPDEDILNAILHDFLVGITGLSNTLVFPRWQPQPPTMPPMTTNWAAIGVTLYEPIGAWPAQVHYDGYTVQQQHQSMEVLATFYGPDSSSYSALFLDGLTIRQNLDVIGTYGIKLHRVVSISYVPELINTQYVPRSDVSFRLIREVDRTYNILNVNQSTTLIRSDDLSSPVTAEVDPP